MPPEQQMPQAPEWKRKVESYRETLARARPDILVMVGSDHFHQIFLDNCPQFLIGKADRYDATFWNEEREFGIPKYVLEGDMAMSINLTDPARVAGFVNPGSEVAIFINGSDPTTGQPYSRVLLTRVKVIAVGSTTPVTTTTTTNGQGGEAGQQVVESLPRTLITLSVSQVQMQRVLLGQQQGELSFALLTEDSKVTLAPPTTSDSLFQ